MKALCRYEHRLHRLHRLHSWAPIPWTPHVRPLRWKGKRVRRWLSSHLSINLPHKLGTRELSWWVILIHFIHHDIGLSRAFLGLPSLWSIALPHWWTHCLFWSDLEIDRILRKHWLYNAWPYNASWLCHETVPCCKIIVACYVWPINQVRFVGASAENIRFCVAELLLERCIDPRDPEGAASRRVAISQLASLDQCDLVRC